MRELFGLRLDQLSRVKGLCTEAVAARLVADMVESTGSKSFDADEMRALRGLLEQGITWHATVGMDPVKVTQFAVGLMVMAASGDRIFVPPIASMQQKVHEERRRMQEAKEMEERRARAKKNTDWAEFIRSQMGDGFGPQETFWRRAGQGTFNGSRNAFEDASKQAFNGQPNKATEAAMGRLGLSAGFTTDDLKKAYRERAKKVHPDVGGTAESFQELTKDEELLARIALEPPPT